MYIKNLHQYEIIIKNMLWLFNICISILVFCYALFINYFTIHYIEYLIINNGVAIPTLIHNILVLGSLSISFLCWFLSLYLLDKQIQMMKNVYHNSIKPKYFNTIFQEVNEEKEPFIIDYK